MAAIPTLINGSRGRMGQALVRLAPEHGIEVVAAIDAGEDAVPHLGQCAAIIDFSVAAATAPLATAAARQKVPLLIGTTGHDAAQRTEIEAAAKHIPILWSGNYSVGVNLLFWLTEQTARILGEDYQPEILELHHRHKQDAPSGTAENLAEAVLRARGWPEESARRERSGQIGPRPSREVGLQAIRGGEIIGEHTVYFIGPHDRLELTHRAGERGIFAAGALRSIPWLVQQPPGIYSMRDFLGLKNLPSA